MSLDHVLENVAAMALQDWAMLVVEPAEDQAPAFEETLPAYHVQMGFSNQQTDGIVELFCQIGFARKICGSLIGVSHRRRLYDGDGLGDALQELVNLITNYLTSELYGSDDSFEFTTPSIQSVTAQDFANHSADTAICLIGEGEPVVLKCSISTPQ